MNCLICKQEKTELGTTTITLERAKTTVVFQERCSPGLHQLWGALGG